MDHAISELKLCVTRRVSARSRIILASSMRLLLEAVFGCGDLGDDLICASITMVITATILDQIVVADE